MSDPDSIPVHPTLRGWIRRTARWPRGTVDALAFDGDDIAQELRLGLHRASVRFDPRRGSFEAFARGVLGRIAGEIRRRRSRDERLGLRRSFEESGIAEPSDRRRCANGSTRDLRLDLRDAIAALPDDLRPLALRLLTGSVAEVARELGWPRSTLLRRIERLKKHFEKAGLEIYR